LENQCNIKTREGLFSLVNPSGEIIAFPFKHGPVIFANPLIEINYDSEVLKKC
jgi:hypothetical protein